MERRLFQADRSTSMKALGRERIGSIRETERMSVCSEHCVCENKGYGTSLVLWPGAESCKACGPF